jgi:hypothetical protein
LGSNEPFFLPLDEPADRIVEGTCVLVVGVATPERIRLRDDNRGSTRAQVLLSRVVLPVTGQKDARE